MCWHGSQIALSWVEDLTLHGAETMAGDAGSAGGRRGSFWRIAAWSTATALVLLPLFAMQVTDEVDWGLADFVFAGALVVGVGVTYELAAKFARNSAYRAAVAVALAATFLLIWANAAVGIIGSEDNPANLMYGGVLAVGIVGAIIARFQPFGTARALVATALAQALVAVIAILGGLGLPASGPLELMGLNGFFIALWLISAWLFRRAAREQTHACAAPQVV